ncbi:peroxide stress protein YaaA [Shewanella salipaludis]|uniref:UPF0246 protein HC757_06170 n=1 Tax=Shewanella salipaludis TaxID=2723052 RepID=A0A972FS94_9GAMM|nr:peroxide stress protein YaaA [Shewanella salipaludis]NMH64752.1 peroxide stress protein YaaA [Shewanella salipaludis]
MLVLVSPAKTLDFEHPPVTQRHTQPDFIDQSQELISVCRRLSPQDIGSLMKVSDKIAGLNAARFAQWQPEFSFENAKQAIFAFRGDVYTGLDADSLTDSELTAAQRHLRILSGLYGLLKPLDLMQPYRLEMGTALANPRGKNLYEFWGDSITHEVDNAVAAQGDDMLVNLASNEYFKAVKSKQLQARLITPVFKDRKNGQYKVISFFAKRARGMMARYLITQGVNSLEQLQQFTGGGYYYSQEESTPAQPTFLREEQ